MFIFYLNFFCFILETTFFFKEFCTFNLKDGICSLPKEVAEKPNLDQNVLSLRTILTRLLPHNCYKHTITYKAEKTAVTVGQRQKEEEKKKACLVPAREKERQDCKG